MKGVSIHLRPLPGSPWITHDPAFGTSTVSIKSHLATLAREARNHPQPLTIISVHLNGLPLRHRVIDPCTVVVSPQLPLQGDRLEVRCIAPLLAAESAPKALRTPAPAYPRPDHGYGLQAPESRKEERSPL